jgi:hypothetical protein
MVPCFGMTLHRSSGRTPGFAMVPCFGMVPCLGKALCLGYVNLSGGAELFLFRVVTFAIHV